ncbi:MAG: trigger factor [Deltaproteobacteria bacterium]|nr:trigger factor [Deltaproteobacteria bacterium]
MPKFIVEEVSPIERRIKVEVEPERVVAELDKTYRKLSRQVRVPGFRPGKVPRRILEVRFKQQVEGDVIQSLVEQTYREAVVAHSELAPVSPPKVTSDELKVGEPFRFQAHVEVRPKVDPKDYEGLELKKAPVAIADAQVDAEIDRLRQAMSQLTPVEGRTVAEKGDFAVVHYDGMVDGKQFAGGKADNVTVELVPGDFGEGNVEALIGAAIGETREVPHTFPADHRLAELAGKVATFKITLDSLKQKKLPEVDDAFAKEVGAGQTLAELKDRIRKDLTERETEKVEHESRSQLLQQLIAKNPFDVPGSMIDRTVERMIQGALERFTRQGIDPRKMQIDFDRLRESLRPQAETEVRGALLMDAIATKEKIEAKPEDLEERVKKLADKIKAPVEKVRAQVIGQDGGEALGHQVREEKTLAFLEAKAKISQS